MDELKTALDLIGNFARFGWSRAPKDNYGVISMEGRNDFEAGNVHVETSERGTIDWFSRDPRSPVPAQIDGILNDHGFSWYFNSLQYEDDTGFLHWEWVWNG